MMKRHVSLVLAALLAAIAPAPTTAAEGQCALSAAPAHPCCAPVERQPETSCCGQQEGAPSESTDERIACTCGHQPDVAQPATRSAPSRALDAPAGPAASDLAVSGSVVSCFHAAETDARDLGPPLFILSGALLI